MVRSSAKGERVPGAEARICGGFNVRDKSRTYLRNKSKSGWSNKSKNGWNLARS